MLLAFFCPVAQGRKAVHLNDRLEHVVRVNVERKKDSGAQGLIQKDLRDRFLQVRYIVTEAFVHLLSHVIQKGVPHVDERTREKHVAEKERSDTG